MISQLINKAIEYDKGDPRRICHFMKVYSFAKTIGQLEKIDEQTQEILEISSILHDIGIHLCEQKYNSTAGKFQEIEGSNIARSMLKEFSLTEEIINRVCFLIAHHHTYTSIDSTDYQILVEADFLVNIFEDNLNREQIISIRNKVFKTQSGINLLNNMFL